MSEQPSTPDSEQTEQLSAYLDGELEADAREQVEQLLARDPSARAQLQRLERAWQLLDGLPRAELEPSFTETTVEMISVSLADELGESKRPASRRRWAVGLVMGSLCLGAALAGFAAVKLAAPDPNAALLSDLPVIENVEQYLQGGDVEFLRKLKDSGLFSRGGSNRAP
jgi:anti-sigma factor RsiW